MEKEEEEKNVHAENMHAHTQFFRSLYAFSALLLFLSLSCNSFLFVRSTSIVVIIIMYYCYVNAMDLLGLFHFSSLGDGRVYECV